VSPLLVRRPAWRHHKGSAPVESEEAVVVEEPLELRLEGQTLTVTLRTPGHDLDLAAGFLLSEGVIDGADDLVALAHVDDPADPRGNTVDVVLAPGHEASDALVADLQTHVRGKLAPYEYPKEIEFIAELPMTTTGKVQRRVLRLQEEARAQAI
jgi:formate dehydrogenase assembly factor FdhD